MTPMSYPRRRRRCSPCTRSAASHSSVLSSWWPIIGATGGAPEEDGGAARGSTTTGTTGVRRGQALVVALSHPRGAGEESTIRRRAGNGADEGGTRRRARLREGGEPGGGRPRRVVLEESSGRRFFCFQLWRERADREWSDRRDGSPDAPPWLAEAVLTAAGGSSFRNARSPRGAPLKSDSFYGNAHTSAPPRRARASRVRPGAMLFGRETMSEAYYRTPPPAPRYAFEPMRLRGAFASARSAIAEDAETRRVGRADRGLASAIHRPYRPLGEVDVKREAFRAPGRDDPAGSGASRRPRRGDAPRRAETSSRAFARESGAGSWFHLLVDPPVSPGDDDDPWTRDRAAARAAQRRRDAPPPIDRREARAPRRDRRLAATRRRVARDGRSRG